MTPSPPTTRAKLGRSWLRPAGRWLVLAAAVVLAWPWRSESSTSVLLPSLSPFIAIGGAIAARAASLLMLLALPVVVLVMFFPRWFCRYGCPTGFLQEWIEQLRPHANRRELKWPAPGQWLVLLTLGGALLGYPLFLWLDPLAIFNGFLNAWRKPIALGTLLTGLGLPLLLLFDLVLPRLWCQRICPLGATQDLLALPRRWLRARSRCVNGEQMSDASRLALGRRWFLGTCAGVAGALTMRAVRGQSSPLRPPGSLDEARFTGVCVRCGNCAQVCPSRIIQPDYLAGGVAGFLAPQLRFDDDYCRDDCHRCNEVCPSGAIARLTLPEKRRQIIGRAVVDLNLCLLAQGRECTACLQKCPYQALVMHSADGGFSNEPRVLAERCNGCGACEAVCPTRPARAIRVKLAPGARVLPSSDLMNPL